MVQLCGWGKEGGGFFFSLKFSQIEEDFAQRHTDYSWRLNYKFQLYKGAERFCLFHILHQPAMGSFLSGVEPENGVNIKMYQPGGACSLLTYFFLVAVFYDR